MKKENKQKKPRGMKQVYALGKKRKIDLSLSENPLGCSSLVLRALKMNSVIFNDYPIPNGRSLKIALARKLNVQPENIFIANGSEAIIQVIPKVFASPGDEVLIPKLTFPMFSISSKLAGLTERLVPMGSDLSIDLDALKKKMSARTRLVFLCNPNNPTGSIVAKSELIKVIQATPQSILMVVDEANIEFGGESVADLVAKQPNLLVLRTFSKGYGLANARIGFAIGNEKLITKLEEETPVFPITGLSEELALVALQDDAFLVKTKESIDEQRSRLSQELSNLGFTVFPSQANNLFVKLPAQLSPRKFWRAMQRADISLVNGPAFTGFDDSFFRVSPRTQQVNALFLEAVKQFINKERML